MDTENTESFICVLAFSGAVIGLLCFAASIYTKDAPLGGEALLGMLACGFIWYTIFSSNRAKVGVTADRATDRTADATSDVR